MPLTLPADLAAIADPVHWPEGPRLLAAYPDACERIVQAAETTCLAHAPAGYDTTVDNGSYVIAVAYQAREVANAAKRDGDLIGVGDHAIRARPMSDAAAALIRPPSVVPATG